MLAGNTWACRERRPALAWTGGEWFPYFPRWRSQRFAWPRRRDHGESAQVARGRYLARLEPRSPGPFGPNEKAAGVRMNMCRRTL
jgi:hypothetical protein